MLVRVRDVVLVGDGEDVMSEEGPGAGGLGVVREGGYGEKEGCEDVEETFLLGRVVGLVFYPEREIQGRVRGWREHTVGVRHVRIPLARADKSMATKTTWRG